MTHLRFYWQQLGGHVHVRVFSGKAPDMTHGKNGNLVFDEREWADGVMDALGRIGELREDQW